MWRRFRALPVLLTLVISGLLSSSAVAQSSEGAILLIMDASGSMNATDADGVRLIDGAKDALRGVVDSLPDGTHVGLRVYGHREPNTDRVRGCQDTELISPVQALDRDAMHAAIDSFEPSGFTPIGLSLREAAHDLPPEGRRTIILVSDGEDTCAPPDPCAVAADLRGDGVDLVVQTVGFALGTDDAARSQLECIAEAGGGQFRDIATADELADELEVVSLREVRRFEPGGQEVEPGTVPAQAPTLELGTTYVADRLSGEFHFYRFEIPAGAVLDAEAIRAPAELPAGMDSWAVPFHVDLVDRDDDDIACSCVYPSESVREPVIRGIRRVGVDGLTEAFLKVHDHGARPRDEEVPVPYEFTVTLVDGAEEEPADEADDQDEHGSVGDDEGDEELPADTASSEGLPTWVVVVLTLLVVLVLGLGALVAFLLKRTAAGPGTPPPPS